jgi:hypothetical protein
LFQNPVGFGQALGKTGQIGLKVRPGFSVKSKEAVPKTEVLEQPHLNSIFSYYHSFMFLQYAVKRSTFARCF